jgi:Ca2+-binding EF-hand superfamily protein
MKLLKLAWSASLLAAMLTYAQTPEAPLKSTIPAPDESNRKGDMARLAQQKSEERFDATDDDKDGQLSRAEVARHLPFFDANFERYDKNRDGMLSWEEFVGHGQWSRQKSR